MLLGLRLFSTDGLSRFNFSQFSSSLPLEKGSSSSITGKQTSDQILPHFAFAGFLLWGRNKLSSILQVLLVGLIITWTWQRLARENNQVQYIYMYGIWHTWEDQRPHIQKRFSNREGPCIYVRHPELRMWWDALGASKGHGKLMKRADVW